MNEWKLSLMLCVNNGKRRKKEEKIEEKKEEEDKKPIRMDSRAVCLIWSSAVRILSQVAVSMSVKRAHENDTREMEEKNRDFFKRLRLYPFLGKKKNIAWIIVHTYAVAVSDLFVVVVVWSIIGIISLAWDTDDVVVNISMIYAREIEREGLE